MTSHPAIDGRGEPGAGAPGGRSSDPWAGRGGAPHPDHLDVLVLTVADREHALPVGDVVEVVRMVALTPLPEAPPWIAGVINMRGRVIPVVDLRTRLGMAPREPGLSTPIVIVGRSEAAAGLIADGASEVLTLASAAVEPAYGPSGPHPAEPWTRARGPSPAVSGMARDGDRLILLLDARRLCEGTAHLPLPLDGDATAGAGR